MTDYDTLRTDRLVGQRVEAAHRELLHRLHREPSVARTLSPTGTPLPAEQVDERYEEICEHWRQHGYGLWMWFEKGSDAFVGRIGVTHTDITGRDELKLNYAIMPGFWGQGLATEASSAVVDLAFERIGVEALIALPLSDHAASCRVAEKLGFKAAGELTDDGHSHVLYRLSREAWRGAAKG